MTAGIVAALQAALGPGQVRTGEAIAERHRTDWSMLPPVLPKALVLARGTADVSTTLRLCHAHGQSVVAQGGMTGLTGGARPGAGDVALSLERLSGVEEVDRDAATLTALAGTPLQVVQEAAAAAGFACGIDLGARGTCTIGGNVATNAGGNTVLRYGTTRQNVRGLEVVLADGTVLTSLNKLMKNTAGYDWTQLFVGSEGTLGVITRVVLALHPRPAGLATAFCAVADFGAALAVLRRMEAALPGRLVAFEAMWRDFASFAAAAGRAAPLALSAPLYLLIEAATGSGADGARTSNDADLAAMGTDTGGLERVLGALLEAGALSDAVIAKSEAERRALWAIRETPAEFPRLLPDYIGFDVGIPLRRMTEAVAAVREVVAARWPDATALFYGHVADSNLHVVLGRPGGAPLPVLPVEQAIYPLIAGFGGTISAEHGIGTVKKDFLHLSRTPAELAFMALLRRAIDPAGVLNPGKLI
jgi:FAD/FMN-containing dehydrogenase